MKDTIYLHYPCFDGVISAVLLREYLERNRGWQVEHFEPINYAENMSWSSKTLTGRNAAVDFKWKNLDVWIDHHGTTFDSPEDKAAYEDALSDPNRILLYNGTYPSAAKLIWDTFGSYIKDQERFGEMAYWANLTDSATYENPYQAVFGEEPALRIASTLGSKNPNHMRQLIDALQTKTLAQVGAMPIVDVPFQLMRPRIERGLEEIRKNLHVDASNLIMNYEITSTTDISVPRFGPFLLREDVPYAISLVHSEAGTKFSVSRNPWGRETKAELGSLVRLAGGSFGGGGHHGVGSVQFPPGHVNTARAMVQTITTLIEEVESRTFESTNNIKKS